MNRTRFTLVLLTIASTILVLFNGVESGGGPIPPSGSSSGPEYNQHEMQTQLRQLRARMNESLRRAQAESTRAHRMANERLRRAQEDAARAQRDAERRIRQAAVEARQTAAEATRRVHNAEKHMRQASAEAAFQRAEDMRRVRESGTSRTYVDESIPGVKKKVTVTDKGRIEQITVNRVSPDGKSKSYARAYSAFFHF